MEAPSCTLTCNIFRSSKFWIVLDSDGRSWLERGGNPRVAKNKNRIADSYDELRKSFTNTFGNVESRYDIPAIK